MKDTNKVNNIVLEIDGPKITATKFTRGIKAFFGFINDVANEVSGKKKAIRWIVSVRPGSININVEPEPLNGFETVIPVTIEAIEKGIDIISNKAERPTHFSDDALKKIIDLVSIVDSRDKELDRVRIWVNNKPNNLSSKIVANIDLILGTSSKAYGTIEGKLQVISERQGLNFVVYDSLTDKPIKCYFDDDIMNEVIGAFGKRISVYGMIRYRKDGEPISIEVEELEVFPNKEDLPNIYDVLGILKD